jgi:hypothetical protein
VVIALTALPRAGTSSRTVIELETLGTVAIDVLLPSALEGRSGLDRRTYRSVARNKVH